MIGRTLSLRTILLLTIGTLAFLILLLTGHEAYVEIQQLASIRSLKAATSLGDQLFDVTEKLSLERDIAETMLRAPDASTADTLRVRLEETRTQTDSAIEQTMKAMGQNNFPELDELQREVKDYLSGMQELRKQIDQAMAAPFGQRNKSVKADWYDQATGLVEQSENLWMGFIKHYVAINPTVTLQLRYKHYLRLISDYTGRQRAIIGRLLIENADPTPEEFANLLSEQGIVDLSWKTAADLADQSGLFPTLTPAYTDARSHYATMQDMVRSIFYMPGAHHGATYPIDASLWLEMSAQATESLDVLKDASLKETQQYVEQLETKSQHAIILHGFLLLFTLSLCAYSFRVISQYVIKPIDSMVQALVNAMEGKPVSMVPLANRQDEIGKLAQVLDAFQKNVEEIKHYAQALERSNKELDDFAYIASHDLKEPLRGIHNHSCFLLEDNKDKLDADSVRKLNRLVTITQHMERLINDLLYFSRLGRQDLAIQPTDIDTVVHDVESSLEIFLLERKAKLIIPKHLPTAVCDKARVTEVFRNLIVNAVKYNDEAEKIVEIGFLTNYAPTPNANLKNVFYVKDNGRGIDPMFHNEIFRIFKRLQSNTAAEDGTGVGLTFVKKIIERHEGKIHLDSAPGKGTTFYFTLEGVSSAAADDQAVAST